MNARARFLAFKEIFCLSLVLCVSVLATPALADDKPAAPDQQAMMKAWMDYATPGAPHKALASMEGSWDVKVKTWMAPGAPPVESSGTSENKMLFDGRYLEQRYEGSMMGQPFHGMGTTGYDNYTKKVIGTWIDSMSTGVMTTTGSFDKDTKKITSWGTMNDPYEKRSMKVKTLVSLVDADHFSYESWHALADGKMHKDLEIHYTRKK